jgi:hypothetical protein
LAALKSSSSSELISPPRLNILRSET